jgi:hypothetical protein
MCASRLRGSAPSRETDPSPEAKLKGENSDIFKFHDSVTNQG